MTDSDSILCAQIVSRTLILKEVAHPCPPRKNQLCNVFNYLRLGLGGHSSKPFRQTNFACGLCVH